MKIELDLSNKASLLRQRADYQRLIAIIELALKGFNGSESELSLGVTNGANNQDEAIFTVLPKRFSISNVMLIAGDDDRKAATRRIEKWQSAEKTHVVEKGKGRRATVFEKIG